MLGAKPSTKCCEILKAFSMSCDSLHVSRIVFLILFTPSGYSVVIVYFYFDIN